MALARRFLLVILVAALVGVALTAPVRAADFANPEGWQRPVDGRVVEPFRAPTSPYGAGHRGVDLAAASGTPVHTANDGVVSFAGDVAGTLHVVVAHDGNLRTSYSFLASVAVNTGQSVFRGDVLGTTGGSSDAHDGSVLHFGLRVGDRYVDPMQLFRPVDLTKLVHLVATDDPDEHTWVPVPEATELRTSLRLPRPVGTPTSTVAPGDDDGCGEGVPLVGGLVNEACSVADWIGARTGEALDAGLSYLKAVTGLRDVFLRGLDESLRATADALRTLPDAFAHVLARTPPGQIVLDLVEMGRRFASTVTADCDDDAPAADGTGGSGHRVMVVAGINSAGGTWERPTVGIDVKALGYYRDEGEIRYFSYTADGGAYTKADTLGDLDVAAQRLVQQLRAMQREEPGREVDLVGHSQGGVVVDIFLSKYYDPADPTLPPLGDVITLSSPHEGAPLSTAAGQARSKTSGRIVLDDLVGDGLGLVPPAGSVAVGQLAEGSPTVKSLFPHGLPEHVNYTTIGADTDYVVPATNISVPGANETVIPGGDLDVANEHSAIVSDADALHAVRSALEGRPPPCISIGKALRGAVVPVLITRFEHNTGAIAEQKLP